MAGASPTREAFQKGKKKSLQGDSYLLTTPYSVRMIIYIYYPSFSPESKTQLIVPVSIRISNRRPPRSHDLEAELIKLMKQLPVSQTVQVKNKPQRPRDSLPYRSGNPRGCRGLQLVFTRFIIIAARAYGLIMLNTIAGE